MSKQLFVDDHRPATPEEIKEAYEALQREEQLPKLVKGAVVAVTDKEDLPVTERPIMGRISGKHGVKYQTPHCRWKYADPLDWETLGKTAAPDDAEWFVRDKNGTLLWGEGAKPVPTNDNLWSLAGGSSLCTDIAGLSYRVPTHEPADDWRDSFRRIERI